MEKLLIYFLFKGQISPTEVHLEYLTNPLAYKIVNQVIRSSKKGIPTVGDIKAILKATESNSEYLKLSTYLDACMDQDTSLSSEEVLNNLHTSYLLEQTESKLADIAEFAINKDIEALKRASKELATATGVLQAPKATKLGQVVDNNIFMLPASLKTLNDNGCRLAGVTIIGAPSGVGKSALSAQEVVDKWKHGISSVYFSLELPAKLLEARILSNIADVPLPNILEDLLPDDIRKPLSSEDVQKLNKAREELASDETADIFIYDSIFDAPTIAALIKQHANEGVKLFVIDYLNLISFPTSSGDASGWSSKAKMVRELNQLCLELGIVIILPTQIDIEKGTDGKLVMKTRGTVELLNTSSLALLLYVPKDADGILQLSVTKARNATKVDVALLNELQHQRLVDLGRI